MQSNKTCPFVEQYLSYLVVIKSRSENTILEYRTDILMFFKFVLDTRKTPIVTEIYTHIDEQQLQSAINSNPLAMMFN